MEPASYEIPIVVMSVKMQPWDRLYTSPTRSSAARAQAVPSTYTTSPSGERKALDSLEWTLRSGYDHQKDLFVDKSEAMRRPGVDKRRCIRDHAMAIKQQDSLQVLREDQEGQALPRTFDENILQEAASDARQLKGPRVVTIKTRESLLTSLIHSPRPTHTLTAPRARIGYARNPTGAFFTS
ncbi:uncharacterized protein [Palaemon carinicauda]|uniref:uncharacterized protein n=1 Tax=Palaemon carinicauda TaxID=392227 RepID=UPI0035B59B00